MMCLLWSALHWRSVLFVLWLLHIPWSADFLTLFESLRRLPRSWFSSAPGLSGPLPLWWPRLSSLLFLSAFWIRIAFDLHSFLGSFERCVFASFCSICMSSFRCELDFLEVLSSVLPFNWFCMACTVLLHDLALLSSTLRRLFGSWARCLDILSCAWCVLIIVLLAIPSIDCCQGS